MTLNFVLFPVFSVHSFQLASFSAPPFTAYFPPVAGFLLPLAIFLYQIGHFLSIMSQTIACSSGATTTGGRMIVNESIFFATAAFLFCAGISFALAASITQPARRRSDIRMLHLTLSILGCRYLLQAVRSTGVNLDAQMLDRLQAVIVTMLLAGGAAFLALTLRRMSAGEAGLSRYQIQLALLYMTAAAVIAINTLAIFIPRLTSPAVAGFWIGYWIFAGLFLLIGWQVMAELSRRLPAKNRSRLGSLVFGTTARAPTVGNGEWWAYLMLIGGSAISFFIFPAFISGSALPIASLIPLVGLVAFVYLRFRAVFIEVIVKRGFLVLILFVTGWLYVHYLGGREGEVAVGSILLSVFWVAFNGPLARLFDRLLFGKPSYINLGRRLSIEMMRFLDRDELLRHVTKRLERALGASFVSFIADGKADDDVVHVVPVRTPDQQWGVLAFGARRLGQAYGHDDRSFLRTVANQLAAVLQNFALRDEQQAQARSESEARELAARAELLALRAQINPHFLYNALNTLAAMTIRAPEKIEAMIRKLACVFRFALGTTRRETVRLGEELDFLAACLDIECERFTGRLRYQFEVAGEAREVPIPPMLIQPLVENAVRHGIEEKGELGSVTVSASVDDGWLRVRVEDDGVGFDIRRRVTKSEAGFEAFDEGNGLGLDNVRQRIERLAGPGHFRLKSSIGFGTAVEFDVPCTH
jgi:signal transduction histidine kinase